MDFYKQEYLFVLELKCLKFKIKSKYTEVSRGKEITGTLFLISLILSSIVIIETQYHYEVQY